MIRKRGRPRKYTDDVIANIREEYVKGLTSLEVAKALQLPVEAVRRFVKGARPKVPPPGRARMFDAKQIRMIRRMLTVEGSTYLGIAKILGVCGVTIKNIDVGKSYADLK